ncbi:uncharacterized protein F5Z01DRAFT_645001 [Emericellopsis atlantica]|uniref:Myb-like domain-containing protein n=1 Tax=Emericellopsis atlantica TaxID=2614577 RepID=A0A9P7ZUR4_9HYPO|nr:uncharacterized protein F5Z01DRAFT_645001 [Emericellopsis atlantica]KAG9258065.1 hypothetical protein F5Z01DRAFT_645001 [Emericellopsis atlantica]
MNSKNWNDRADKDLFFTILSVKNIGVISGSEWVTIGNALRAMGYGFTNEGCRQHFQGLRRAQSKAEANGGIINNPYRKNDPTLNPITRRPGPGRGRPKKAVSGDGSQSSPGGAGPSQLAPNQDPNLQSAPPVFSNMPQAQDQQQAAQQHQQFQEQQHPGQHPQQPHPHYQQPQPGQPPHPSQAAHHFASQQHGQQTQHYGPGPDQQQQAQAQTQLHNQTQTPPTPAMQSPMGPPPSAQATKQEPIQPAPAPTPPHNAAAAASPNVGHNGSGVENLSIRSEDGQGEEQDEGEDGPPVKRQRLESQDAISQDQPLDDDDPVLALADANNGNGGTDQYPPE